jgi:hypothetical protein
MKMRTFWDVATCRVINPLKRRPTPVRLHGAISQKALNFILDALRTSNLT